MLLELLSRLVVEHILCYLGAAFANPGQPVLLCTPAFSSACRSTAHRYNLLNLVENTLVRARPLRSYIAEKYPSVNTC